MPLTSEKSQNQPPVTPGRVRQLLKSRGLSQASVARAAGIGEAELSRIVARSMQPTPNQSRRLLEILEPHDEAARTPIQVQVSDRA